MGVGGEALEPCRRAQQQGCRGQSGEIPTQRIGADQHSPTWEACLLTHWGRWRLGAEAWASEVRPQGEDWGWLCEDSLKGASAPQLARRESRKKSGPAGEARDQCFGVHEERWFPLHVPTKGRAPAKGAPEMGTSQGYQLRPQRRAWTANAVLLTPRILCASTGHYQHPPAPHVQHATARVPWSRDNFPGRTHSMPQAVVMSCWPLPQQACPTCQLWLPYPSLSPAWVRET